MLQVKIPVKLKDYLKHIKQTTGETVECQIVRAIKAIYPELKGE